MRLAARRTAATPRRRSTGSGTPAGAGCFRPPPRSQQPVLLGPGHAGGERLAVLPPIQVAPQHPPAVVRRLGLGHLVAAELAAERGVRTAEVAAQVYLEALDHLAGVVLDHRALEADVGGLEPGAAVRAAVDVDRDRCVELGQPLLELRV